MDGLLLAVVAIALLFDYTNGFHDAANAVATSISTRAVALFAAALLNVAGAVVSKSTSPSRWPRASSSRRP